MKSFEKGEEFRPKSSPHPLWWCSVEDAGFSVGKIENSGLTSVVVGHADIDRATRK